MRSFLLLSMLFSSFSLLMTRKCARSVVISPPSKRLFTLAKASNDAAASFCDGNRKQPTSLPKAFFVLGGPGSGKGTQCELLSREFGLVHLSAGKIVPVEITLQLLQDSITNSNNCRFLIDGFPRNWDNLEGWQRQMEDVCEIDAVLFFECPERVLEERLLSRGLTSGRSDDNLETIRKRFRTFHESTIPIVNYFDEKKKVIRISGEETRSEVNEKLKRLVLPFLQSDVTAAQNKLEASLHQLPNNLTEVQRQCSKHLSISSLQTFWSLHEASRNQSNDPPKQVTIFGQNASVQINKETWQWSLEDGAWKLHAINV